MAVGSVRDLCLARSVPDELSLELFSLIDPRRISECNRFAVTREMHMNDRERDEGEPVETRGVTRRSLLHATTLAGTAAALTAWSPTHAQGQDEALLHSERHGDHPGSDREIAGASIAELQASMASGRLSARQLLDVYERRIRTIDK